MKNYIYSILLCLVLISNQLFSQNQNLVQNPTGRNNISLNGKWKIIIDPYENGFYNYRALEKDDGFFLNQKPKNKQELIEYDFDKGEELNVPGDWNSQREDLKFYEGTVWYKKDFTINPAQGKKYFLYFSAVNYEAIVYLNGKKLGKHIGGFTPFNFEITSHLQNGENFLVVKVDNKRKAEGVPTLNTDWWNYGGITRDVYVIESPEIFVQDYLVQLKKNLKDQISGWVKLSKKTGQPTAKLSIPELKISQEINFNKEGLAEFDIKAKGLNLWSPESPKLYEVLIICNQDTIKDEIGFRNIETKGQDILLNGKSVFLKGICIHEEAPFKWRRANGIEDAKVLLGWAKELGCNYVRLAHYPHNEPMVKLAEKYGLMVWSEIPVYWTIKYEDSTVFNNAKNQLAEMITRDKNRAGIIIWSMANETPVKESRNKFIKGLADEARKLDPTRLISAALEIHTIKGNTFMLDDPLGEYLDVLGCNEYIGWYGGVPEDAPKTSWETKYNKPLVISEFGGGALYNHHGNKDDRWTEEYQENLYINHLKMFNNISFLRGVSPWVLMDFRSPRRQLPEIQDFWNRKGIISDQGQKKKAYFILKEYYRKK